MLDVYNLAYKLYIYRYSVYVYIYIYIYVNMYVQNVCTNEWRQSDFLS